MHSAPDVPQGTNRNHTRTGLETLNARAAASHTATGNTQTPGRPAPPRAARLRTAGRVGAHPNPPAAGLGPKIGTCAADYPPLPSLFKVAGLIHTKSRFRALSPAYCGIGPTKGKDSSNSTRDPRSRGSALPPTETRADSDPEPPLLNHTQTSNYGTGPRGYVAISPRAVLKGARRLNISSNSTPYLLSTCPVTQALNNPTLCTRETDASDGLTIGDRPTGMDGRQGHKKGF